jgi:mannose-6-phosphate isomerase-like protein (cupin superfamily)
MKLVLILLAFPLVAADPPGFSMWTGAELQSHVTSVKLDDHKVGVDKLATWDNHALWVIRREGDGEAEVHDTQVDVIFVTSGEGTLVIGGTMVEPRTTAPGEIRAKSIKGGVSKKMAVGDVFNIPAKLPHQMLVPKLLTFEVLKVESK